MIFIDGSVFVCNKTLEHELFRGKSSGSQEQALARMPGQEESSMSKRWPREWKICYVPKHLRNPLEVEVSDADRGVGIAQAGRQRVSRVGDNGRLQPGRDLGGWRSHQEWHSST